MLHLMHTLTYNYTLPTLLPTHTDGDEHYVKLLANYGTGRKVTDWSLQMQLVNRIFGCNEDAAAVATGQKKEENKKKKKKKNPTEGPAAAVTDQKKEEKKKKKKNPKYTCTYTYTYTYNYTYT